jgi:hypothetical protein
MILVESLSRSGVLFEHDLFRKPVPTFRVHALTGAQVLERDDTNGIRD